MCLDVLLIYESEQVPDAFSGQMGRKRKLFVFDAYLFEIKK